MWLSQEQRKICIIVGQNQHNEVKKMNTYLKQFKMLKDIADEEYINIVLEDLLGIIAKHEGNDYVISLLGDYINEILEG